MINKLNLNGTLYNMGAGGQGGDVRPDPSIVVLGDSTATDEPTGGGGTFNYNTKKSIFKWLATWLNARSYTNFAVNGYKIASVYAHSLTSISADTDTVFIQVGINDIASTETPVGYASIVMGYECNNAKGVAIDVEHGESMTDNGYDARLKDTLIGYYRLFLDYIRKKCGEDCKIYVISPLYYNPYDVSNTQFTAKRQSLNQFREELHNLVDAMNTEEETENYVYISGLLLGVDAANYSSMYVDQTHPNDKGAHDIAENMLSAMRGYYISPTFTSSVSEVNISAAVGGSATSTYTVSGVGLYQWRFAPSSAVGVSVQPQSVSTLDGRLEPTTITVTFSPTSAGVKETYILLNGNPKGAYVKVNGTASE